MVRVSSFDINKYVSYNSELGKSMCLACEKMLSGKRPANIKRHYLSIHKKNIGSDEESDNSNTENRRTNNVVRRSKLAKPIVKINISKKEFLMCCTGIVTVKNIPLAIFDDEQFFKRLIEPYEKQFNVHINSKNIGGLIDKSKHAIKNKIISNIKNKLISLKVDIATRNERRILGINVQYIKDFRICINTIGMVQMTNRHTGAFLKEEILKCLRTFDIDVQQLYSCTSDNGSNVIKLSELLKEQQEEEIEHQDVDYQAEETIIESEIAAVFSLVRCAAHTLQLAANDVIKTVETQLIDCRSAVKLLRGFIKSRNINVTLPTLDNSTRWNSTYEMVSSLHKMQSFIENNEDDISFMDIDWHFIAQFVMAFKPLKECTLQLQKEQYVLGDFYRDWLTCELELQDEHFANNRYAASLLQALETRKKKLLDNDVVVAALYLDPRFNYNGSSVLSEEQKQNAVNHLIKTFNGIKRLEGIAQTAADETSAAGLDISSGSPLNTPDTSECDRYAKLREVLGSPIISRSPANRSLKQKLLLLSATNQLPIERNVLQHWKHQKPEEDLLKLIEVVFAVPATQVSVERAFSALSTILTKLRCRLSSKNLENILLVKLNFDLLQNIPLDLAE